MTALPRAATRYADPVKLIAARHADTPEIDALLDAAFGPGRLARTAALLRQGSAPLIGPSLVARGGDGGLLGTIQLWPVELAAGNETTPLTLFGPVAVAADARQLGLGRRLLAASLDLADAARLGPIVLIGDLGYYGPFGFDAGATQAWSLPGPVDRDRLLLRNPGGVALPAVAMLGARTRCPARASL